MKSFDIILFENFSLIIMGYFYIKKNPFHFNIWDISTDMLISTWIDFIKFRSIHFKTLYNNFNYFIFLWDKKIYKIVFHIHAYLKFIYNIYQGIKIEYPDFEKVIIRIKKWRWIFAVVQYINSIINRDLKYHVSLSVN